MPRQCCSYSRSCNLKILLLNQCFYPDVVSTAQHLTDLANALTARGHEVTVVTSDRGYDDPTMRFPRRERWNGIEIIRIPSVSLGKSSKWRRAFNFGSFLMVCSLRLLTLRRFDRGRRAYFTTADLISRRTLCETQRRQSLFLGDGPQPGRSDCGRLARTNDPRRPAAATDAEL